MPFADGTHEFWDNGLWRNTPSRRGMVVTTTHFTCTETRRERMDSFVRQSFAKLTVGEGQRLVGGRSLPVALKLHSLLVSIRLSDGKIEPNDLARCLSSAFCTFPVAFFGKLANTTDRGHL